MTEEICRKRYLQLLSKKYPDIKAVSEEIINLQAILNLPKGTELFLSDIHGEYGSFSHILNNGSGIIKSKIEELFGNAVCEKERRMLAILIYYPEEKLALIKKEEENIDEWYKITLYRLIQVAKKVSSKYTRSKVRKALTDGFDYIIDELLHFQVDEKDKKTYNNQIINSIIELGRADDFIIAISNLIKRMAIDHLHVVGDIYDRGSNAKEVMDRLEKFHSLDIQWGNHDILWMGACCGNLSCIANVVRICARYNNLDTVEDGYGINIRPLFTFAMEVYKNDDCSNFMPKIYEESKYSNSDKNIIAKVHKAIAVIQFKIEGRLVEEHPEYNMGNYRVLDKIDFKNGTITLEKNTYELNDTNFPTIDPINPYKLTTKESELIERLQESFMKSELLNEHVHFLYTHGSVYKIFNSNLLFHGCIPMKDNGDFQNIDILNRNLSGKNYFDFVDEIIRKAYFEKKQEYVDLVWYFWCSPNSPFFGKDKMTTFERYFIDDKAPHKENKNPFYKLIDKEEHCEKILVEFGLNPKDSHIICGHMPVKEKDGESPIKGNGKLLVIDGGFAKSYRKQTGRAGYTLTYNSYGLILSANEPFDSKTEAIENEIDTTYDIMINEKQQVRKKVADTDIGTKIKQEIEDLKLLLDAYKEGTI